MVCICRWSLSIGGLWSRFGCISPVTPSLAKDLSQVRDNRIMLKHLSVVLSSTVMLSVGNYFESVPDIAMPLTLFILIPCCFRPQFPVLPVGL